MKNNYSIAQRNAIVEDHLWCIDSIIQKNRPLMRAARLEYDDVYQQLAIRLIKAVAGYDPDKGNLQQHIFAQLKYELLNCKAAFRLCGMTGAPRGFQKSDILTMRKEVKKIPGIRYSKYTWNPAYKGVDDYLLSRVAAM